MTHILEYAGLGLEYLLLALVCALAFGTVLFHFLMGIDNPHTAGAVVFFRPKTFLSPRGQWYRRASLWCFGLLVIVAIVGAGLSKLMGLHD